MVYAGLLDWFTASITYTAKEEVVPIEFTTKPVAPVDINNRYASNSSTTTIKAILEKEFRNVDIRLVDVARCESRFRQLDKNGAPLRGEINPKDVGVMQINEKYWLAKSKQLGYDIYTLGGNIEMAKHIYKVQGIQAWNWSSPCHKHK